VVCDAVIASRMSFTVCLRRVCVVAQRMGTTGLTELLSRRSGGVLGVRAVARCRL
jgi:hypothetical protein